MALETVTPKPSVSDFLPLLAVILLSDVPRPRQENSLRLSIFPDDFTCHAFRIFNLVHQK